MCTYVNDALRRTEGTNDYQCNRRDGEVSDLRSAFTWRFTASATGFNAAASSSPPPAGKRFSPVTFRWTQRGFIEMEPLCPRWNTLNDSNCWVKSGEAKRKTLPSVGSCSCYWKPSTAFFPPPSSSDIQREKVHLSWTKPFPVVCSEHLTLNPGEKLRHQNKG